MIHCKPLIQGMKQFLSFKIETNANEFVNNYIFPPKEKVEVESVGVLTMILTGGIAIILSGIVIAVMCVI